MKPGGATSRSKLLKRTRRPGSRVRPPDPSTSRTTSVEQFVRRAAADARSVQAKTMVLAPADQHHRSLFEPGSYAALAFPAKSSDDPRDRRLSVDGLPVDSNRFGVAVCTDLLHQVAEPRGVLGELNRALEAEGRLYLTSPLVVDPSGASGRGRGATRLGMNYLLEATGFSLDDLQAVGDSAVYAIVATKARPSAVLGLRSPR